MEPIPYQAVTTPTYGPLAERWRQPTNRWGAQSAPVAGPEDTILLSEDSRLRSVEAGSGQQRWSREDVTSWFPPVVRGESVVVRDYGRVLALSSQDGTTRWEYPTSERGGGAPTLGRDGSVYQGDCGGNLYALNSDGELKWKRNFPGELQHTVSVCGLGTEDEVVVYDAEKKQIHALSPGDGTTLWSHPSKGGAMVDPEGRVLLFHEPLAWLPVGERTALYALDGKTGNKLWKHPAAGATLLNTPGRILLHADHKLTLLENSSGEEVWSHPWSGPTPSATVTGQQMLFSSGNSLGQFNLAQATMEWSQEVPFRAGTPTLDPRGRVLVRAEGQILSLDETERVLQERAAGQSEPATQISFEEDGIQVGDQWLFSSSP